MASGLSSCTVPTVPLSSVPRGLTLLPLPAPRKGRRRPSRRGAWERGTQLGSHSTQGVFDRDLKRQENWDREPFPMVEKSAG